MADYRGKNPRTIYNAFGSILFLIGLAIVVFGIVTLIKPERHLVFFPILFVAIAVLFIVDGIFKCITMRRGRQSILPAVSDFVVAIVILAVAAVTFYIFI